MFEFLYFAVTMVLAAVTTVGAVKAIVAGASIFTVALGTIYDYDTDGPNAQFDWADLTTYENYDRNFFHINKFGQPMKEGSADPFKDEGAPIVYVDNLSKGEEGDKLRFPWLGKLRSGNSATAGGTNAMVFGNNTMEDNEEQIRQGDLDVFVDQVRGATGFIGRVSAIRAKLLRNTTIRVLLKNLAIEWLEDDHFYALYNGASQHLISLGVYSATAHPNRYYARRSLTDPMLLQESDKMSADLLDFVLARWQYRTAPLPYAVAGNKNGIIGLISEVQEMSLKQDTRFWELNKDALARERDAMKGNMHPLFSNSGYKYGVSYLYCTSRVFTGDRLHADLLGNHDSSHHGALFLGSRALFCAQAGVAADSMPEDSGAGHDQDGKVQFYFNISDSRDYGNENKQALAMIYGYRRADFTQRNTAGDDSEEIAGGAKFNNSSLTMWTKEPTVVYA